MLGALFINITLWNTKWRKPLIGTNNVRRVIECIVYAFVTASLFYLVVTLRKNNCRPQSETKDNSYQLQWTCPTGEYNPLATIILNTERGTLEEFFRYPEILSVSINVQEEQTSMIWDLTIYFLLWYFGTAMTFGIWVPAGIFVPGMLMGCALGLMYLDLLLDGFHLSLLRAGGQSYLVIGAAGMLSGYTRLTYSLAVIMMETTQSVNLFIPVLITIMVSHQVGRMFNRSLYEYGIRGK